jgi:arabinan endo-1,5-alpha-L-arabinosidase
MRRPGAASVVVGGIALVITVAILVVVVVVVAGDSPTTPAAESDRSSVPAAVSLAGDAPVAIELRGATTGVHDPMAVAADDAFWLFSTGPGISVRRSNDLAHWEAVAPVFAPDAMPQWWTVTVAGHGGREVWAPEVSWFGGQWHLYYSISLFGQQTAAIGHATNPTLDPTSARFGWVDHGPVVVSGDGDEWTAIDPHVALDADGEPWLAWGSGFGGIWIQRLDPVSGELASGSEAHRIAKLGDRRMIEAPFLVHRSGWWYLFTSRGRCCAGIESTYQINVGRSRALTGPYHDADGRPLIGEGGTLVLRGEGDTVGPGHNSVLEVDGDWWLVHHFYDGASDGAPTLGIQPLGWDDEGWPMVPGFAPARANPPAGLDAPPPGS